MIRRNWDGDVVVKSGGGYVVNAPKPLPRFCGADCRKLYQNKTALGDRPILLMHGQRVSHVEVCARLKLCAGCRSKLEK